MKQEENNIEVRTRERGERGERKRYRKAAEAKVGSRNKKVKRWRERRNWK